MSSKPQPDFLPRDNNFNALRLGAALAVLFSHSFDLAGDMHGEPLRRLSHGLESMGHVAVVVFFGISGFLITRSFDRSRNPVEFIRARALRLLPGLAVCVLALAFVLGPLATTLPLGAYLTSWVPSAFVAQNLTFIGWRQHLPGVFEHNPFPQAVDGSLWTLKYEVVCYLAVLAFGMAGLLRRWASILLALALVVLVHRAIGGNYFALGLSFAVGAVVYLARLPLSPIAGWGAVVLCCVALPFHGVQLVVDVFGAYAAVALGSRRAVMPDPADHYGDMSYGIYVWAFPMQQVIAEALGRSVSWELVFVLSLVPVVALGWLSWRFVEAPALRRKRGESRLKSEAMAAA